MEKDIIEDELVEDNKDSSAKGDESSDEEEQVKETISSPKEDESSDEDEEVIKKKISSPKEDESSDEEEEEEEEKEVVKKKNSSPKEDESSDEDLLVNKNSSNKEDESSDEEQVKKKNPSPSGDESSEDEELVEDKDSSPKRDESSDEERPDRSTKIYDFDIMMAKKKEENSRKRRRRGYDIINDNDDIIADIINQMKDAAHADAEANTNKQAAIRKLKLLPSVMSQLRKIEMRDAFLDSDVLSVITEWLAPLPDRSLPHLQVREAMLKTLMDMNLYDVDRIKNSGIGKAVMYLFKHPKETKENKHRAKHLISCWSRPIFQLDSSFNSISREEREQRDLELMNKQRKISPGGGAGPSNPKPKKFKDDNTNAQKPGDKGWIPRARVPAPSMRDYVIRPPSKVDGDIGKNSKRPSNMLEKYMKSQQERRRAGRQQRAINMNIDRG